MNSFSAVERALRFEEQRQRTILGDGGTIEQETRGWVEDRGITVSQRTKEQAHDYRYFPEPDLPPLAVSHEMVQDLQSRLPELPSARYSRLTGQYGLEPSVVALLTAEREVADVFEATVERNGTPDAVRTAANWIANDVMGLQRARGLPPECLPLGAAQLRDLLDAVATGELTSRAAKELLPQIGDGEMPRAAAARLNLLVLDDEGAVRAAVTETLTAFPSAVADYRGGKTAAIGRLIGETIKRTGGRAKPDQVRRLLEEGLRQG